MDSLKIVSKLESIMLDSGPELISTERTSFFSVENFPELV